jgi:hypothetical protein
MVPFDEVREWLADHGYRDLYPRRDAAAPDTLFYVFVKPNHPRLGVRVTRGKVKRSTFDRLQQVVRDAQQDD